MEVKFKAYIVDHVALEDLFSVCDATWESQGIDDSYWYAETAFYTKPFEGGKKVEITVRET